MVATLALAITATTATAASAEPSTSELTKKIDKASDQLEDIVESYNKLNISLKKTKADEKQLAASLAPAKAALAAAGTQMDSIVKSAYMTGHVGAMNVVLEGSDNLMDRMSILEQISRSRGRDIAAYRATTENYAERQAALKATQDKQAAELKELNARKKKIEADLKKLYAMRTAAYGKATETSSKYTGSIPSIAGSAGKAVTFAYNALGVMYDYGADGPDGYDCSGLTSAAWRAAGKSLPHNAAAQYSATTRISRSDLKPGDLVFYRSLGHVGLYVGGGQIIDASRAGQPVKKRTIDIMPPYGYGRVN
ncbi:C40 family peptidase [Amorphoplanes nipponensis]|uniref:C40 family peptidase n=1 Tax=Actinoplanes nipponensis TaxID=135950 RepID=UPI001EF3A35D|nr:NlpC/P60 family protein [Actinoplanes nipponensis]